MQITDAKVIAGRLSKVRDIMKSEGVDIYVVVTGDYHISEYAGDYFKEREFITGFTGSAGTAVITQDDARLFTDGRYFVQAEKQIEGTGFSLMNVQHMSSSVAIICISAFLLSMYFLILESLLIMLSPEYSSSR